MSNFTKRIIFAGMPDMGYICLDKLVSSGVNIVGIIPPKKSDKTYDQFLKFVERYNIPVLFFEKSLDEEDFIQKIKSLNADLGVVCSYNHKFPSSLLNAVKGGFLNVHPSLLPDYRGPNPYSNVIINNEKETGITYHYMDESFDTGEIVAQVKVEIDKDETMGTLFSKLSYISADCLVELLENFENSNGFFKSYPQPQGKFKYAKNYDISLGNTFIDWSQTPEKIDEFIRALNPYIGAYSVYNQEFVRINSVKIEQKSHNEEFGTVVDTQESLKIACKGGFVQITSLQYGSYFISDAQEFIKRTGIKRGEMFK